MHGEHSGRAVGGGPGREGDRPGAVSDGVAREVSERTLEQRVVPVDARTGPGDDDAATVRELRTRLSGGAVEERVGSDRACARRRASERPQRQERLREGADVCGVVGEPVERRFVLGCCSRLAEGHVYLGGERAERRAELVTGIVDELLLPLGGAL